MKIYMLTWEYPPRIVGGISRHCEGLAQNLAKKGHDIHVITLEFPGTPHYEERDGVKIHRVPIELGHPNFVIWTLLFNHFMEKRIADVSRYEKIDIIHASRLACCTSQYSFKTLLGRAFSLNNT